MRKSEKFYSLLLDALSTELGTLVTELSVNPVSGFWKQQDVYRVEGLFNANGQRYSYGCWDTMTKCCEHGLTVVFDDLMHYEVHANI